MIIFFGRRMAFKKILARYREFEICQFYTHYHIFFIPLFWQRGIGLFHPSTKSEYYEFDSALENKLLKLPKNSDSKLYIQEIEKYNREQEQKQLHYIKHKIKYDKKENKEFIQFLKGIGILLGLVLIFIIIKSIFF